MRSSHNRLGLPEIPPSVSASRKTNLVSSRSRTRRQLSFPGRILCRRKRGRIGVGVRSNPGETKRVGTDTRVDDTAHAADDRLTMIYDTREFRLACLRVRHFGTSSIASVQSELRRFINLEQIALTRRGINLYNNLIDPDDVEWTKV